MKSQPTASAKLEEPLFLDNEEVEVFSHKPAPGERGQIVKVKPEELRCMVPPEDLAPVNFPRLLTLHGRNSFLRGVPTFFEPHPERPDAFIFQSHLIFGEEEVEAFFKWSDLMDDVAQWHTVRRGQNPDRFLLRLLPTFNTPLTTGNGKPFYGCAFQLPVQMHPMPDGFAFLVHQEIIRVKVQGERDPANVAQTIMQRNERCGFRTPGALRAVADLQSDSAAFKEQWRFNHEAGYGAQQLAVLYERDEDTLRHHMRQAFNDKILRSDLYVSADEMQSFRDFMSKPGRLRQPRKKK